MRETLRKSILTVLFMVGLILAGPVATSGSATTGENLADALDSVIAAENGPPGLSVQVVKNGRSQYFSRGKGNLASGSKPKFSEHFRIASVSKAYSVALAFSLIRRGKLKLSDTIGELLPGLLPKANRVTLAQALHHTGGLPDYIRDEGFIEVLISNPRQYLSPKKLISFVKDKKLTAKPGREYEYSDTDNIVVGLMAEKVTGVSYEKLMRRHIYQRYNLSQTSMPRTVNMPRPFLRGYEVKAGEPTTDETRFINPALAWASGGMVSILPEVGRFFRGYVGGKLLTPRLKRAQRSWVTGSSSPPGPGTNRAGLGLFKYTSRCGTVYGHTGSFPGYRIFAASSADGKRSISYVTNAQITSGPISDLIRKSQVEAVCHALK